MAIVDRIKQKCKEKNTSMNALEKELGFGNGTIRMWDVKEPGSSKVILVAEKLGLSLDWLLTGKESEELTAEEQELVNCYRAANDQGKRTMMTLARLQKQELESSESKIG